MAVVNLLYATKVNLGGWATFTVHLYNSLKAMGHDVFLLKVGNRTETFLRPFADHGISYRNVGPDELADEFVGCLNVVAALGKHYVDVVEPLLSIANTGVVVHDTAESTNRMAIRKPWVIRKELLKVGEGAVFIRHPYARHNSGLGESMQRRRGFMATSRVDFDKNTRMILDANRLGAEIDIVGFENRLYTRFKVCPDYPEWVQSKGDHPRSGLESTARLANIRGMVDLTDIKGDGGGTQYTFLEAWDAGAVPIIGGWWLRNGDDMRAGVNCLSVTNADQLAKLAKRWPKEAAAIAAAGTKALSKHAPKIIAPQVIDWLEQL